MKLATLKTDRRDGQPVVVSSDFSRAVAVPAIAPTLQAALDDWGRLEPRLREVASALHAGRNVESLFGAIEQRVERYERT